jgi:hypothetical protein
MTYWMELTLYVAIGTPIMVATIAVLPTIEKRCYEIVSRWIDRRLD